MPDPRDLARDVVDTFQRLDGDRMTAKAHWQECADYMQPNRADYIVTRAPGAKRMQKVFDAVPVWAAEQLAAGLHSHMTNPFQSWFGLQTEDDRRNSIDRVRLWLEIAGTAMMNLFNSPRHNFASQSSELYGDAVVIGTAVMGVLESQRSDVLFSARHLKECCIAENEEDRVDTLVRFWEWTAKQAVQQWGKAAGEKVLKAYNDKPDTKFSFYHMTRPRLVRDPQRADKMHKAFESVYVAKDDLQVISQDGFDEFPFLCPRFYRSTGETYGRSPAMTALPDVKMLNELNKLVIKSAQKLIDPVLQLPDIGFMMPIKTHPGAMNFYRAGSRDRIQPIETGAQPQIGIDLLGALRQQIIRQFYVDWLIMPSDVRDPASSGKGVTATYVLQQRDEKMRLLSPMLARMQSEFLGPLIDRVFAHPVAQERAAEVPPGRPQSVAVPAAAGRALGHEAAGRVPVADRHRPEVERARQHHEDGAGRRRPGELHAEDRRGAGRRADPAHHRAHQQRAGGDHQVARATGAGAPAGGRGRAGDAEPHGDAEHGGCGQGRIGRGQEHGRRRCGCRCRRRRR
jgi:hypothetical protein